MGNIKTCYNPHNTSVYRADGVKKPKKKKPVQEQEPEIPQTDAELKAYVKRVEQLLIKERSLLKSLQKMERQITDEPASEAKYAKLDLVRSLLPKVTEPLNYWDNAAKKVQDKKEEAERARLAEAKRKKVDAYQREMLSPASAAPEYNRACRHFCETVSARGAEISCAAEMDMTYCSRECAFATNMPCRTAAYGAQESVNGYRRWRNAD